MVKNTSRVVVLLGAILILAICATVKCGGGGKGDGPVRRSGGKSVGNELAAATADTTHNESLAAQMQAEEEKKSAANNTGGYSDAAVARELQAKEDAKARKKLPQIRSSNKRSANSTNGTVRFPGPCRPCCSGILQMQNTRLDLIPSNHIDGFTGGCESSS